MLIYYCDECPFKGERDALMNHIEQEHPDTWENLLMEYLTFDDFLDGNKTLVNYA